MITYDFYDMSGWHLDAVTTNDPDQIASEISHFTGIDADEVTYEPRYGDYVAMDGNLYQIRGNGNRPQLYFISSLQVEIEETQLDASIYTQEI